MDAVTTRIAELTGLGVSIAVQKCSQKSTFPVGSSEPVLIIRVQILCKHLLDLLVAQKLQTSFNIYKSFTFYILNTAQEGLYS